MVLHSGKSYHPIRTRQRKNPRLQFRMASMIDVVFLLLIFFLLAANFRQREGFLPAELPQQVTRAEQMEMVPLEIWIESQVDGSCEIQIGMDQRFIIESTETDDASGAFHLLSDRLSRLLTEQGRSTRDPIKFMPSGATHWDHVVKAYDALWQLNLEQIIFVLAE